MKAAATRRTRVRTLVKVHALDWITAALAATAVALLVLAMVRAAGAAPGAGSLPDAAYDGYESDRRAHAGAAEADFVRRVRKLAADVDYYIDNVERAFEQDLVSLERGVSATLGDYERDGNQRDFDREVRALGVRLDQLGKRIDSMATRTLPPRKYRP